MLSPSSVERFAGALLGTFAGDALGRPVEGMTREAIAEKHGRVMDMIGKRENRGRYTDDTQLMICVAESLSMKGGFDGSDMASRFAADVDPERGYGRGTLEVVAALKKGARWDAPAMEVFGGGGSYGNGAAMRVAPVGLMFHESMDALRAAARDQARITHTHPVAIDGAVIQAAAVALAYGSAGANLDVDTFLDRMTGIATTEDFARKITRVRALIANSTDDNDVVRELGNGVRADASVPTAIYSFLRHPDDMEETIVHAVNLGGDTDTIGAMAGAIAGARNGARAIPGRWLELLEEDDKKGNKGKGRAYVAGLAMRLHESRR